MTFDDLKYIKPNLQKDENYYSKAIGDDLLVEQSNSFSIISTKVETNESCRLFKVFRHETKKTQLFILMLENVQALTLSFETHNRKI